MTHIFFQADMVYNIRDNLDLTYQDTGVQPDGEMRTPLKNALTETTESFGLPVITQSTISKQQKMAEPVQPEPLYGDNMVQLDAKPSIQQEIGVQVCYQLEICLGCNTYC